MISDKTLTFAPHATSGMSAKDIDLLIAATRLIDEGATWNWSLRDLADGAGVPSNAIFRKFGTREKFVSCLAKLWALDVDAKTAHLEGVPASVGRLMWMAYHRERVLFLVSEGTRTNGYFKIPPELSYLMPDFPTVAKLILEAHPELQGTRVDWNTAIAEAAHAGLSSLMFEKPSLECTLEENQAIFVRIFHFAWQLATGLALDKAPSLDEMLKN